MKDFEDPQSGPLRKHCGRCFEIQHRMLREVIAIAISIASAVDIAIATAIVAGIVVIDIAVAIAIAVVRGSGPFVAGSLSAAQPRPHPQAGSRNTEIGGIGGT